MSILSLLETQKLIRRNLGYFIKNSLWTGIRQAINIVCGLALSVSLARLTSPETVGNYALILAILALVSLTSIPGLNISILKSAADGYDGSYPEAVRKGFLWSLSGSIILLIMGVFYLSQNQSILSKTLFIAAFFFPLLYAPNTWDNFLQGKRRFDLAAIYGSLQTILSNGATIIAIVFFPNRLDIILLTYFLTTALTNLFWFKQTTQLCSNPKEDPDTFPYGLFLTRLSILNIVANNIDRIMIGALLGPAQLGVYTIGTQFANKIFEAVKSLLAIWSPQISTKNTLSFSNYLTVFVLSWSITIPLYLATPYAIHLLYSSRYNESITLSRLVIPFLPFYILYVLYSNHVILYLKDRRVSLSKAIIYPISKISLMIPLLFFHQAKGLAFLLGAQNLLGLAILVFLVNLFRHYRNPA